MNSGGLSKVLPILAAILFSGCLGTGAADMDNGMSGNMLADETSPYLLQHADNPVHWRPWGEEAFEAARRLQRPIFLSIGYSSCHWCHVMEEECFEDDEVAALLNDGFICVKVDREERPDVDAVYMRYSLAITGGGGWPLTIIMTPEGDPFFAATYIPKHSMQGRMGMMDLIPAVMAEWENGRDRLDSLALRVSEAVSFSSLPVSGQAISAETADQCFRAFEVSFDSVFGGFGGAPKFPSPHAILFLLRYWHDTGESSALDMAAHTMRAIRSGGIYDQVGYGLHRYSTDARWLIPHFEKMLYDQAMFILAAVETYEATGDEVFREMAESTIQYVLRDMTSPEGAFYSSEDADSGSGEGDFYIWKIDQMIGLLGEETAEQAIGYWGLTAQGNFAEPGSEIEGRSVLHVSEGATGLDNPPAWLAEAMPVLLDARSARSRPFRDEKILTDWNGLMIAALARSAGVLDRPEYLEASIRGFDFVAGRAAESGAGLVHSIIQGSTGEEVFLDDYVFMIRASLEIYSATFDAEYLAYAITFQAELDSSFAAPGGGYYFTSDTGDASIPRFMESYDGALPSGSSVELWNLTELWRLTGDPHYRNSAEGIESAFASAAAASPSGHAMMLSSALAGGSGVEVVVTGERDDPTVREMLHVLAEGYHPRRTVLLIEPGGGAPMPDWLPDISVQGSPAAYVCREGACMLPVYSGSDLSELLSSL